MIPDFTRIAWAEPKAAASSNHADTWLTPEGITVRRT